MTSRSSASRKNSLLLALAILLVASTAMAKKRVVVTKFDGRGDDAQRAATAVVAREATVVSDAAWRRSLRKLKLKAATSPDAVARVAGDVQADGVVKGSVQRTGKQWGLTLTVLDGRTGQVSDTLSIPLRSYRMDTDAKRAIAA